MTDYVVDGSRHCKSEDPDVRTGIDLAVAGSSHGGGHAKLSSSLAVGFIFNYATTSNVHSNRNGVSMFSE